MTPLCYNEDGGIVWRNVMEEDFEYITNYDTSVIEVLLSDRNAADYLHTLGKHDIFMCWIKTKNKAVTSAAVTVFGKDIIDSNQLFKDKYHRYISEESCTEEEMFAEIVTNPSKTRYHKKITKALDAYIGRRPDLEVYGKLKKQAAKIFIISGDSSIRLCSEGKVRYPVTAAGIFEFSDICNDPKCDCHNTEIKAEAVLSESDVDEYISQRIAEGTTGTGASKVKKTLAYMLGYKVVEKSITDYINEYHYKKNGYYLDMISKYDNVSGLEINGAPYDFDRTVEMVKQRVHPSKELIISVLYHTKFIADDSYMSKAEHLRNGMTNEHICESGHKIYVNSGLFNKRCSDVDCKTCANMAGRSSYESVLHKYIESLGFVVETNARPGFMKGDKANLELDLYVPSMSYAIEVNGLFWHCEGADNPYTGDKMSSKQKHSMKYKLCHDAGVKLQQFTDHDIRDKEDIVRSMVSASLGKNRKVYAKNCSLTECDDSFFSVTHIRGHGRNGKTISLTLGTETVAAMKVRMNGEYIEIERYANALFTTVVGGFSKLLKQVSKLYPGLNILSYSYNDFGQGQVYDKNGFELIENIPYFYYTDGKSIYSRQDFMKHKILERFGGDPSKTEEVLAAENGFYRYYTAGNTKWIKVSTKEKR